MRVPGPPRGRRRAFVGDVVERIQQMRAAEGAGGPLAGATALLRVLQDVILLLKDLIASPRVSRGEKVVAALAVAYLLSPVDLVPDWLPLAGQADDLAVAVWAARRMLATAGYEHIYELWRGTDEGLALVLTLAGVEQ